MPDRPVKEAFVRALRSKRVGDGRVANLPHRNEVPQHDRHGRRGGPNRHPIRSQDGPGHPDCTPEQHARFGQPASGEVPVGGRDGALPPGAIALLIGEATRHTAREAQHGEARDPRPDSRSDVASLQVRVVERERRPDAEHLQELSPATVVQPEGGKRIRHEDQHACEPRFERDRPMKSELRAGGDE